MIIDSGLVTGSLQVIGNTTMTGSLSVTGDITGNIKGNAQTATSASYALTSSYALFAATPTVQGVQGTQGIQGIAGDLGGQGIQGIQGLQGVQGTQGIQGLQGADGYVGVDGAQGTQGTQGVQGIAGDLGGQGIQGIQGITGATGIQGATGSTGSQGTTGAQGTTGQTGAQGSTGSQGTTGATGIQGVQGIAGGTGAQGSQGTTGFTGAQGTQGTTGSTGAQGSTGSQGSTGAQGTTGTQGVQGIQGIQGPNAGITSYTNASDNRVITSVNSSTINAESNLTFDGSLLSVTGYIRYGGASAYSNTGLDSNGFYQDVNGTNIYQSTMRLQSNILSGVSSYNGLKFGAAAIGNASEGFTIFTGGYDNNRLTINASGNATFGVDARAPIFYDSNDTGYYANPAGSSLFSTLNGAYIGVANTSNSSGNGISLYNGGGSGQPGYGLMFAGTPTFGTHGSVSGDWATYFTMNDDTSRGWIFRRSGTNVASISGGGILQTSGYIYSSTYVQSGQSMYSPIYYDANDSAYYTDPNSATTSARIAGSVFSDGAFGSNGHSSGGVTSRVFAPKGAAYSYTPGTVAGAIKIRLPNRANDTMWSMKVRIYNYQTNQTAEYLLGNYSYSAGAYNFSATYLGGESSVAQTVRFGNQGGYDCVWIGETSTVWTHPVVSVMDFMGGYSNGSAGNWNNGWEISLVTSFGTVAASQAPNINFNEAYAYSYRGNGNVGGTGAASWHPSGIYCGSTMWQYGAMYKNNSDIYDINIGYANSSLRAPIFYDNNDTSYYADFNSTADNAVRQRGGTLHGPNATWGAYLSVGGDGRNGYINNTGVASVASTNGNLHLDAASGFNTYINFYDGADVIFGYGDSSTINAYLYNSGYLTVRSSVRSPIFYDLDNTGYYVDPASTSVVNVMQPYYLRRNTHSTGHLEGSYNNVGANDAKSNPIYTIGSSYNPTDTSLSNMYGIGYAHPNFWGSGKTPSWGMYVADAGSVTTTLGQGIWTSGDVTAYSDIRVKDNIEVIENAIDKIKAIRGVTFTRKDASEENKDRRHAGVIAQEVMKVLPEVVTGTEEDKYSVAYGNMAGLFIEAIKEQQTQIDELKQLVKQLTQK